MNTIGCASQETTSSIPDTKGLPPYRRASRQSRPDETVIRVREAVFGSPYFSVIAGPLLRGKRGTDAGHGRSGQGGRRNGPARRRIQAQKQPLQFPGIGGKRP